MSCHICLFSQITDQSIKMSYRANARLLFDQSLGRWSDNKTVLLGMKWVFKHQDLQIFGYK